LANGNQADAVKRARKARYRDQPTYKYPQTGERFRMRDRSRATIDPESPTAAREWEINTRGGAYSDRILAKRKPEPERKKA